MIRLISCAAGWVWKGGWSKLGVSRALALTMWLQAWVDVPDPKSAAVA